MRVRRRRMRAPPAAPAASFETRDQRRQPVDGRHRQDAGRGRDRAMADRRGPAPVDSQPRLRPRGCGRRRRRDRWRDHGRDQAGDEPLMLARQVPGATVCVSPDRYLGGVLAEKLGCTVHVLDDGFQHIELARDLDILVTTIGEIPNGRVIPRGRLREPKDAAARAHFLVVTDATAGAASAEAWALGISQSCGSLRTLGAPVAIGIGPGIGDQGSGIRDRRVLAVAGIANPERFVASLTRSRMERRRCDDVCRSSSLFSDRRRDDRSEDEERRRDCGLHDRQGRRPLRSAGAVVSALSRAARRRVRSAGRRCSSRCKRGRSGEGRRDSRVLVGRSVVRARRDAAARRRWCARGDRRWA